MTYGRAAAMQESAFIYGWAANAGLAVVLWILGRLGGFPLRSLNWVTFGTAFWNFALLVGIVGIALGDGTSHAWMHLPKYVLPLMLVAHGAISVAGVLAWTGRRQETTFAAQWYAIAALFLMPWLFSAAQMMLVFACSCRRAACFRRSRRTGSCRARGRCGWRRWRCRRPTISSRRSAAGRS
jgi:cytochrome c oxidase cbb3-type subunit 1